MLEYAEVAVLSMKHLCAVCVIWIHLPKVLSDRGLHIPKYKSRLGIGSVNSCVPMLSPLFSRFGFSHVLLVILSHSV